MINNKAVQIMRGMSRKDMSRFEKFLHSPFFNTDEKIIRLFEFLQNYHPAFSSQDLEKKNIYKFVYGKERYNDVRLRKLFSDYYKLAEQFLVQMFLEESRKDHNKFLLYELDSRKIDNLFLHKYSVAMNHLNESGIQYETFFDNFYLKWQLVSFHLNRGEQYKISGEVFERTEQLIFFFLSDLFISLTDISINKNVFNYEQQTNLPQKFIDNLNFDKIFDYIQKNDFKNKEVFSMYYYSYLMNKHLDDESYYFTLRDLVVNNLNSLNIQGKRYFILRLITYCNSRTKKIKDMKFELQKLELYKMYLYHQLYLIDENYFRTDIFISLFSTYLDNNKFSQAEDFVEKYISSINPSHSSNVIALCNSLLLFEKGKFREALARASTIKSGIMMIKIHLRKLILKIDYEINEYDENKDALNNFLHFVSLAKSLTEEKKKYLLDFGKMYADLIKLKLENSEEYNVAQLKEGLESLTDMKDKEWFEKQLTVNS